ncbi:hypothetical protein K2Z84_29060 [Candidatus Binatia bacterium]|nr:hypothetical protein [Candidatus Binatia bacterium]
MVVVFPQGVARVGDVRRALRRLSLTPGETLLVVATRFTREAAELVRSSGGHVVGEDEFWSEDGYQAIRDLLASPRKFPAGGDDA